MALWKRPKRLQMATTVTVPIMTNDEIGQIAKLINTMNVNLQDLIMQIRQEISRHRHKIEEASKNLSYSRRQG